MTPGDLKFFVGKAARLTTTTGSVFEGRVIAYCDGPSVEIEQPGGHRLTLAASVIQNAISLVCTHCGGTGVAP